MKRNEKTSFNYVYIRVIRYLQDTIRYICDFTRSEIALLNVICKTVTGQVFSFKLATLFCCRQFLHSCQEVSIKVMQL